MNEGKGLSRRDMLKGGSVVAIGAAAGLLPAAHVKAATGKAPRWAFVVDLRRCVGCRACTVACKAEFDVPLGAFRAAVYEEVTGTFPAAEKHFLPRLCNHCEGSEEDGVPPCVKICPEYPKDRRVFINAEGKKIRYRGGATYKRPDGMILYDNDLCVGCGKCIDKCPYGARNWDKSLISGKDATKNGIAKCSFCEHRVANGVLPACVNICPAKARVFGDLNDPDSEVSKLVKQFRLDEQRDQTTMLPSEGTVPMLFYVDPKGALTKTATAKAKYEGNDAWVDQIA